MKILVLWPNQLVSSVPDIIRRHSIDAVYILHDPRFFRYTEKEAGLIRFHKLKVVLHDVTTRIFRDELVSAGVLPKSRIVLVDYTRWRTETGAGAKKVHRGGESLAFVPSLKGDEWFAMDAVDNTLNRAIQSHCKKYQIHLTQLDSPLFIATNEELMDIHKSKFATEGKRLLQTTFYAEMRRRHGILLTAKGKWEGDKLTFDVENRLALPRGAEEDVPTYKTKGYKRRASEIKYIRESIARVNRLFRDHPADSTNTTNGDNLLPTDANATTDDVFALIDFTRESAMMRLRQFCRERLARFGDYQDAMVAEPLAHPLLYHSGISHTLNIGLIQPREVIDAVIAEWKKRPSIPISAVEGFIRQVLGWREYTRYIYVFWNDTIRPSNAMKGTRRLTDAWYSGTTGWTPVDTAIKQAFRYGYLHHIQRLMIMGNIMNLMRFHPHEVYRWFMEFAIDSYEWVMVYNVYSMILYADGGMTTTKPYISSSAYIYKMSNGRFKRDGKWDVDWTTLFYSYIGDHQTQLEHNGRTVQMWNLWKRKSSAEQRDIRRDTNAIIERLTRK